ncbi:MAG: HDIG domain-containing protein [Fibrella sp.]|nr:HDIG domain-containing protein [Armatimonadota bacterium]
MTRPNPLLLLWHRWVAFPRDTSRRRRRNAIRVQEAMKRGGERRAAGGGASVATGFSWRKAGRIGLAIVTSALLTALLCLHLWPNRVSLNLGDIADKDIVAQRTVRYEDTAATEELRNAAMYSVGRRYDALPDASKTAVETTKYVFDIAGRWAVLSTDGGPTDAKTGINTVRLASALSEIHRQGAISVQKETVAYLFRLSPSDLADMKVAAATLTERIMARPITDENSDLSNARNSVATDTDLANLFRKAERRKVVADIIAASLVPNRRFDARKTADEQQAARSAVPPQLRRVSAGEPVVRAGERINSQHKDAFAALGLQNARLDATSIAVIGGLVTGMVVFVTVYLRLFHRKLYANTHLLLLLAIQTVLAVVGLKIGSLLLGLPFSGVHFGYLGMMCVASAGMAIALLIDASVATLIVALLSIASGMVLNNELRFTLLTLGSSLAGIVAVATLKNRSDYLRATLILCATNTVLNALVGLLEGERDRELLSGVLWGGISGLFAMALFYTGVAIFERWFGITTHLRLLELSDPATPILQEFRLKAPGTYAHSLMVGTLAHAAAEGIGADSLLCRVAAYYHDLGKMNRPEFFIENQSGLENVHDRIAPSLSALVLSAHVKDGVEMCRAMGMPPRVIDVVEQHHGTTLMKFFYYKAAGGRLDPAMEAQFRYPGPKPQSKEAAILLLADSVEAASRSLEKPTPARIETFVAEIIEDKRADAQLDECDLTLWELKMVQETFARTLSGALHARIAYPGDRKKNQTETVPGLPEMADMPTPDVSFAPPPSAFMPLLTPNTFNETPDPIASHVESDVPDETQILGAERRRRSNPRREQ